jgi:hypothetical protein
MTIERAKLNAVRGKTGDDVPNRGTGKFCAASINTSAQVIADNT